MPYLSFDLYSNSVLFTVPVSMSWVGQLTLILIEHSVGVSEVILSLVIARGIKLVRSHTMAILLSSHYCLLSAIVNIWAGWWGSPISLVVVTLHKHKQTIYRKPFEAREDRSRKDASI
ncbi:hypothetical protein V1523DRAFT_408039 [Lipomyces doorenjongii]